jgi:alpha-L-fucosidase
MSSMKIRGAAAATFTAARRLGAQVQTSGTTVSNQAYTGKAQAQDDSREQRMQWWHAAKFGMFIHFGVYSTVMRHEWEMQNDGG